MSTAERVRLFHAGYAVIHQFGIINGLTPSPEINVYARSKWLVGACAYYRQDQIAICLDACAPIGWGGRALSYPGNISDRTPYGVLAHELGHHYDFYAGSKRGDYWSEFSASLRVRTREKPITSYAPDDAEWFAEIFRLFVTNPDLLRIIRPKTFEALLTRLTPLFSDTWQSRLAGAPDWCLASVTARVARAMGG